MNLSKVLLGAAGGFAAGYAAWRWCEAARELRRPSVARKKDAAAYGRTRRAMALADTARTIAGASLLAYGPLARRWDDATSRLPVWLGPAAFLAGSALASAVWELPVEFVQDYAIERRFGLSDRSARAWFVDHAKGTAIGLVLSTVLATLFGLAVRRAPRLWPLFASAGVLPLLVLANVIAPTFLMPLFNRFEPLRGALEQRLRRLASRYGAGDAEILRMDMSRQTRKANAFVTGVLGTQRIVVGDTLLGSFPDDEIEFVVAHELGHYVSKDPWRLIAAGQILAALLFGIAQVTIFPRERKLLRNRALLLARLYLRMIVATQLLRPLMFAFSRSREWAADRFARKATNAPRAGAAAFARLRDQNLAEDDVPGWYELFFSSHPSLRARISALQSGS